MADQSSERELFKAAINAIDNLRSLLVSMERSWTEAESGIRALGQDARQMRDAARYLRDSLRRDSDAKGED